jgi:peptide/nickel transport system substrate-binding protein
VKQLLQEAGYKGEKITILANKRVHVPSYPAAVITQAMLQAAGINAEIEVIEWATQLDRYNKGNYQMMSFSYSSRLDPSLSYEQFSGPKDQQPRKVWEDPKALELLARSMTVSDEAERQKIFDEMHQLQLETVPLIILYNSIDAWGVVNRVKGFSTWESKPRLWGVSVAN